MGRPSTVSTATAIKESRASEHVVSCFNFKCQFWIVLDRSGGARSRYGIRDWSPCVVVWVWKAVVGEYPRSIPCYER